VSGLAAYDPFGKLLQGAGASDPFGFTGERSTATGLQYLRARWYDPSSARFTQVDPFAGVLGAPGTQHPYAYGLNNPLTYSDPSGRIINVIVGIGVGAFVGAGAYALFMTLSGQSINKQDMLAVAATGAIAGGLIGSGLIVPALIGSSAGSAGLGYLSSIFMTGSRFQIKDFGIAVGIGAVVGYLTPVVGTTWLGIAALDVLANVAQYGLTELVNCRKPSLDGVAWSAFGGLFSAGAGGPYTPVREVYDLTGSLVGTESRAIFRETFRRAMRGSIVRELPRSYIAVLLCNLPNPLPENRDND